MNSPCEPERRSDSLGKPYPAYRDSGVEWLGEIPAHWDVPRLKNWVGLNERVLPEDTDPEYTFDYMDIGSVETGRLAAKPERLQFGQSPSRARRVVRPGDTLVSTVRTYLKAVWHADDLSDELIASTGFAVLTPRRGTFPKFVSYFCQSDPFTNRVTAESVGIAYPAIAETTLGTFEVSLPPLAEQGAIVRFLDHADRRIRRTIRAKEKLITLLEEQKQAIIQEAVTGQIDVRTGRPYPAYNDSRMEWIGEVPAHWSVRHLGRIGQFFKGGGGTKADERKDGVPCVRYGDLYTQHRYFITASRSCVTAERAATKYTPIHYGDVLFAGSGETLDEIGKSAVNLISGSACCGGDIIVFRPTIPAVAAFLGYATDCPASIRQKASVGRGFTVVHIYTSDLKYMTVALPPLSEQTAIARFLDDATHRMSAAVASSRRQIERLHEYRTRLIADVVTGKLDVRDAAAALPEMDTPIAEDHVADRLPREHGPGAAVGA